MKILLVTNEFSHPDLKETGGIGRFYSELSLELVNKGHKVWVLGYNCKKMTKTDGNLNLHFIKKINSSFKMFKPILIFLNRVNLFLNFILLMKKNKIDIIELNDPITAFTLSPYVKRTKKPLVLRQHGMPSVLSHMYGEKKNNLFYYFEKRAHYKATTIISVSEYIKKVIKHVYGENLIIDVVYNGIKLENSFEGKEVKKKPDKNLLYVAALSERKGYLDLVDVFNELIRNDKGLTLTIIGRESEIRFKELEFSQEALKRVKYYGYLDYANIKEIYKSCDLFLNFSKGETFGLTTVEAMSFSLPVIISNIGVAKEIVDDGVSGYIVDMEDKDGIVRRIIKLLADEKGLNELGKKARLKVFEKFSREILYKETIQIYKRSSFDCN